MEVKSMFGYMYVGGVSSNQACDEGVKVRGYDFVEAGSSPCCRFSENRQRAIPHFFDPLIHVTLDFKNSHRVVFCN